MIYILRLSLLIFILSPFSPIAQAETLRIAVASNFQNCLAALLPAFQKQHASTTIRVSSAATGVLFHQIRHGAPFDVLLAADALRPKQLEALELGRQRLTYAIGRLSLISRQPLPTNNKPTTLTNWLRGLSGKLAIANPDTAPFGLASKQTLTYLNNWPMPTSSLVTATNIRQSLQFFASSNAAAAFINSADADQLPKHYHLSIPSDWHAPIRQQAILLQSGFQKSSATSFMNYLQSASGQQQIRHCGYQATGR